MRAQLLDPLKVERAVLTFDVGLQGSAYNPLLAVELCRAVNRWSADRWLAGQDSRLYGAVLLPAESVDEAVAEIRRYADHHRMVLALVVCNAFARPFGHPAYYPIYRAAAEAGMPVGFHTGAEWVGRGQLAAAGKPGSRLEYFTLLPQGVAHHVTSLLSHGVFDLIPGLKVLFIEQGFSWVPNLLWNLDAHWDLLKIENPQLKSLPSDAFRSHVRLTTQPFDESEDPKQLIESLEAFGGMDDLLCFATDYPHWDADEPSFVTTRLPKGWHEKVFFRNAEAFFGWPQLKSEASDGG